MSASLLIPPRIQFEDANGNPLAGGLLYSYQAGTTTPMATYTDATGSTAATNPIVLDAAGSASVWLGQSAYKLVLTDANGVQQWSVDNVSSVSLAQLQGSNSFSSLAVSGALTAGSAAIAGALTAASETISGAANVGGALTVTGNGSIAGNASVGGALSVTGASSLAGLTAGATTVSSLSVGTQTLAQVIAAAIPALSALSGQLVLTNIQQSGSWVLFTFGGTPGTRIVVAFGAGTVANGAQISLPSGGFSTAGFYGLAAPNSIVASSGNALDTISCTLSGLTVACTGADQSGHTYSGTANWIGLCWITGA